MSFIKLPDDLTDWAWFGDNVTLLIYIRLRFAAKYKAANVGNVHLERGQVATSIREIAETNSVSIQQARTALERLKSTSKITIKSTPKISIITLIDYDCDFENNTQDNILITNKQHTKQQTDNKLLTNKQQTANKPSLLTTDSRLADSKQQECARTREAPEKAAENSSKPEKRKFAEFVSMTNEEYSSLVTELGEQGAKRCIEILDNYKGQSGRTYKSDFRAIKNWVITRYGEEQARQSTAKPPGANPDQQQRSRNPFINAVLGGGDDSGR